MPDKRKHRGTHPQDADLFSRDQWPLLQRATGDLCWLQGRGYASPSSLKLVGDRYDLTQRQRIAVSRCACPASAAAARRSRRADPDDVRGEELWVDGYNLLTTIETALGGGVVLAARDGCYRDMASMHGTYRKVAETVPALELVGACTADWGVRGVRWFLDAPVSNSGRLKRVLTDLAEQSGWNWQAEVVPNPDTILGAAEHVVVTADSVILDRCQRWLNVARIVVSSRVPDAYVVDLSAACETNGE